LTRPTHIPDPAQVTDTEPLVTMPPSVLRAAVAYLLGLLTVFAAYECSSSMRSALPASIGELPLGVAWFAATGAVVASLYGIFVHNQQWRASYNYWHYCRPLFGAVTGSMGALFYLVLLRVGSKTPVTVDPATFYAVAFVFGFADKSFLSMLTNVVRVVIKPGNKGAR